MIPDICETSIIGSAIDPTFMGTLPQKSNLNCEMPAPRSSMNLKLLFSKWLWHSPCKSWCYWSEFLTLSSVPTLNRIAVDR